MRTVNCSHPCHSPNSSLATYALCLVSLCLFLSHFLCFFLRAVRKKNKRLQSALFSLCHHFARYCYCCLLRFMLVTCGYPTITPSLSSLSFLPSLAFYLTFPRFSTPISLTYPFFFPLIKRVTFDSRVLSISVSVFALWQCFLYAYHPPPPASFLVSHVVVVVFPSSLMSLSSLCLSFRSCLCPCVPFSFPVSPVPVPAPMYLLSSSPSIPPSLPSIFCSG